MNFKKSFLFMLIFCQTNPMQEYDNSTAQEIRESEDEEAEKENTPLDELDDLMAEEERITKKNVSKLAFLIENKFLKSRLAYQNSAKKYFYNEKTATNALLNYANEQNNFELIERMIRIGAFQLDDDQSLNKLSVNLGDKFIAWYLAGDERLPTLQDRIISDQSFSIPPNELSTPVDIKNNHVPVIFLIEQDINIKIGIDGDAFFYIEDDAILLILQGLVSWDQRLIVASKGLTCDLLSIAYGQDKKHVADLKNKIINNWLIYSVPDTQFTVWVPKKDPKVTNYYKKILNIQGEYFGQENKSKPLILLSVENKNKILNYCPPEIADSKVLRRAIMPKYRKSDLEKIFNIKNMNNKILDVYISGHGGPGSSMAGLPVTKKAPEEERITSLLTFFSKKVKTGIVWIDTCSAGGQNTTLVQTQQDGIALDYDYILIIGASSDKLTVFQEKKSLLLIDRFFSRAKDISSKGHGLNDLLKETMPLAWKSSRFSGDIHGYASLPQVWLPRQIGFQTFDIDKAVESIGKVTAAVHEQENKIMDINLDQNKLVILWYPDLVNFIVDLLPTRRANLFKEKKTVFSTLQPDSLKLSDSTSIYPEFLLMGGMMPRKQLFKHIRLPKTNSSAGVLRFLRDSFGVGGREPRDTFIRNLTGTNDLTENIKNTALDSPLLKKIKENPGKPIKLKNVMIRFNNNDASSSTTADWSLYFEYGNEYWIYKTKLNNDTAVAWDFKKLEGQKLTDYQMMIKKFKKSFESQQMPKQKTIPEILKNKLKKAPHESGIIQLSL